MNTRYQALFGQTLTEVDSQLAGLIDYEAERQARKIILIPSESLCPAPVREALGSVFTNIYAEGYPRPQMTLEAEEQLFDYARQLASYRRYANRRFYKGTEYVDILESIAQQRIAHCFATDEIPAEEIYVNIQPLSGAAANNSIYEAFVEPGGTVMGMDLSAGGHLTHGSPFNRSGRRYQIVSYGVDPQTERLDYDAIMDLALTHRPQMIIAGYTSYPWAPDWQKFRAIADACGAILLADIAHTAGMVIAGAHPSPVGWADVISFTTHKTVFGPRGAVILTTDRHKARAINTAVFPGEQGGPHTNKFAAMAVAFKIAQSEAFHQVQHQIVANARALADALQDLGIRLVYGGTDTHLLVIDLRALDTPTGYPLMGEPAARILDLCGIVVNKNTIPGDRSAAFARGIRLGTPWITQRGYGPDDMRRLAAWIHQILTHIHPFEYPGMRHPLFRGKIELEILEEVAAQVDAFLREGEAETEDRGTGYPHFPYPTDRAGAPQPTRQEARASTAMQEPAGNPALRLYDLSHWGLLAVRDWRATALLQETMAGNILALSPGQGMHTAILRADGSLIDDPAVFCTQENTYLLLTQPSNTQRVKAWLRGLSDGYILFDPEDLQRKIQGPAIIEDLRTDTGDPAATWGLDGPEAHTLLQQRFPELPPDDGDWVWPAQDGTTWVCRLSGPGFPTYLIITSQAQALSLGQHLREAGAQFADPQELLAQRQAAGLPTYVEDTSPAALSVYQAGHTHLFDLTKPYFVGQTHFTEVLQPTTDKTTFHFTLPERELLRTPLYEEHQKLGARLVPFAGWEMPVWYTSIWEEHQAVRQTAGLFDVGHMGVLEITGAGATDFLDLVTANYVAGLEDGVCHYSYILAPNAHVIDDLLVYRRGENRYMIVVNAANKEHVEAWLHAVNRGEVIIDEAAPYKARSLPVNIRDMKTPATGEEGRLDLALQGPASQAILEALIDDPRLRRRLQHMQRFEFIEGEVAGMHLIISTTGYTGEAIGYEIYVDPREAVRLWRLLLETGAPFGLRPAGLGARDSTRTEAGFPLYGHELAGPEDISPIEAGYGGFIKWHKPYFIGRDALKARSTQRAMKIVRFAAEGTKGRPIREHDPVILARNGRCIGHVTSAVVLDERQVGMAFVEERYADVGTELHIFPVSGGGRRQTVKPFDQLSLGDSVPVPRPARIISRFRPARATTIAPPEE